MQPAELGKVHRQRHCPRVRAFPELAGCFTFDIENQALKFVVRQYGNFDMPFINCLFRGGRQGAQLIELNSRQCPFDLPNQAGTRSVMENPEVSTA